ncbi:MAG: hypothetical protein WBG29_05475, partial [Candidatus Acidiferrales bacterium]
MKNATVMRYNPWQVFKEMRIMRRNAKQEIREAFVEAIKACGLPTPDDDLLSGKKPPDLKSKKGVLQAASSTLLAMGMQNPKMRRKPKDEAHL